MSQVTLALIGGIIQCILLVILYLLKTKVESLEQRLTNNEDDMVKFKDNYLDRFEKINKNINNSKIEILEKLHAFELHVTEKTNQNQNKNPRQQ